MYEYSAEVTKVIDGDTIDATVDMGMRIFRTERLRLYGINTMEMKDKDPAKRALAQKAKDYLEDVFHLNPHVTIQTYKSDVFGRWLAEVYLPDGTLVNKTLIDIQLAVPYMTEKEK